MKKINVKDFKNTLSKFTTGVTVVCVKDGDKIYGKTVNSFNSLSLQPPLVLFSLGKNSSSLKIFLNSKFLSINILSKKQKNISDFFSKKNPDTENIEFINLENNTIYIDGCIANLECKQIEKIKKGDHIIFICKVLNIKYNNNKKPLTYFNSKYN